MSLIDHFYLSREREKNTSCGQKNIIYKSQVERKEDVIGVISFFLVV
jgi:hypothetical protein